MKKTIAAIIGVPLAFAAHFGDDVLKFFGRYVDDLGKVISRNGDDISTVAGGVGRHADDIPRVPPVSQSTDDVARFAGNNRDVRGLSGHTDDVPRISPIHQPTDDVARVAPGVVNLKQAKGLAKQAVYQDVHNAILSGINQNSINDLLAVAKAANEQQFQQTGVLLSDAALLVIVYQAGAANASPRIQ